MLNDKYVYKCLVCSKGIEISICFILTNDAPSSKTIIIIVAKKNEIIATQYESAGEDERGTGLNHKVPASTLILLRIVESH